MNLDLTTIIASVGSAVLGYITTNGLFSLGKRRESRKKGYIDLSNFFAKLEFEHIDEFFGYLAVDNYSEAFREAVAIIKLVRDPDKAKAHMLKILRKIIKNQPELLEILTNELNVSLAQTTIE